MKNIIKRCKAVLTDKSAEGYIDTAILMIISVVIGGLVLSGLYYLFNSVILPGLAERIQDMFGFSGGGGTSGGSGGQIVFL